MPVAAIAVSPRAVPPGILALHDRDRAATLSGDPDALARLWTADAYRAEPGHPAEIGIAAIHADDVRSARRRRRGTGMIDYRPHFNGIEVHDGIAVEWGCFDGVFRSAPGDRPLRFRGNLLRVLRRLPSGEWRFSRVVWTPADKMR